jgi:hypothetical protein
MNKKCWCSEKMVLSVPKNVLHVSLPALSEPSSRACSSQRGLLTAISNAYQHNNHCKNIKKVKLEKQNMHTTRSVVR